MFTCHSSGNIIAYATYGILAQCSNISITPGSRFRSFVFFTFLGGRNRIGSRELLNKNVCIHHVLHSVGCLVIANAHIFSHAWNYAIVCLFKRLTLHHLHHIYTLSCRLLQNVDFPAFSTNVFLRLSFSFPMSASHFLSSVALSVASRSFSPCLSPGVSESWAVTGGPWQEVGWLVRQVTLHSCGSPRAKHSPLWCGMSVGPMVAVAFLKVWKCTAFPPLMNEERINVALCPCYVYVSFKCTFQSNVSSTVAVYATPLSLLTLVGVAMLVSLSFGQSTTLARAEISRQLLPWNLYIQSWSTEDESYTDISISQLKSPLWL